ncbi:MAG: 2',3'-cyclic-nucleotide 2'-phosphodiesterase (5'-nucleotidase family) [Bacteriovoracaceae bacterium]
MGLYLRLLALVLVVTFLAVKAEAKDLMILHTNDLHAFLSSTVEKKDKGGYATIKAMIDREKQKALDEGMEVLVLDAGDFLEGSLYYMADNARSTFDIMNKMGYDAITVGNHDWLMGTKALDKLLKEVPPTFAYLGANFKVSHPIYRDIKKSVKDYIIKDIGGMKVAIMGITTDELFYSWRFENGKIYDPVKTSEKLAKKLKKDLGVDYVISLNHTGLWKDKKIIEKSKNIDFIVGGHSHSTLRDVYYHPNKKGRKIGIVQAGEHGNYLGRLTLKLEKGEQLKVTNYKLLPVIKKNIKEDNTIRDFVSSTDIKLGQKYGRDWLDEIIGTTLVDLTNKPDRLTYWSAFIADAMRESVKADVAIHVPNLTGTGLSKGPISREDMINAYPRFFDFEDKDGWNLYTADIYGALLKSVIRAALKYQRAMVFSGVSFDLVDRDNNPYVIDLNFLGHDVENPQNETGDWLEGYYGVSGKLRVTNILIDGKPIVATKKYRIALPEGLVIGGLGISRSVAYILRKMKASKMTMWKALENKIKATRILGADIGVYDGSTKIEGLKSKSWDQNRTFIPNRL